jgi:hypothetical protein
MSIVEIALLVATIVLVALIFYIAGALVSREWSVNASYVLRLLVVSLVAVFVIPVFGDATNQLHLAELGLLLAFVLLIFLIRFILVDELVVTDDWLASIVIALIGVVLIYIIDEAARQLFDIHVLAFF